MPTELFELVPRLTHIELRALLYLLPHVRREGGEAGDIPLDALVERITAPAPGGLDPGLSRVTFLRACEGLVSKGVLLAEGQLFDPRLTDFRSCRLRLRMRGALAQPRPVPPEKAVDGSRADHLLLVQDLTQIGLTRRQARELVEGCAVEEIERQLLVLPFRGAVAPVETMLRAARDAWPPPPQAAALLAIQPGGTAAHREARERVEAHLGAISPAQRVAVLRQAAERIRVLGGGHFTEARQPHRLRLAFARWILAEQLGGAWPPRSG